MRAALLLGMALIAMPVAVSAQGVAVAPHLGTLGIGADVAVALSDVASVRAGANFQPYTPEPDISDLTYALDLPSPSVSAMLDLHPGGGSFRFSAGFVYFTSGLSVEAVVDENVDIGNNEYTPAEVGTLSGELLTNAFAPYVGIGFGNAHTATTGFFMDLGVAFHGTPDVELSANGPASSDPQFQADLNMEITEVQDDVENVTVYPVLSLGVKVAVR